MEKDYDELIGKAITTLDEIKKQMELVKVSFLNATGEFVKGWFEEKAKSLVTENNVSSSKLSSEQLKELKGEVQKIAALSNEYVDSYINKEHLWWHTKENDKLYPTYMHRIPEFISDELVKVLGKLGIILSKYEIIKIAIEFQGNSHNYDFVMKKGEVVYRYTSVTKAMVDTMKEYGELHGKALGCLSSINHYNSEKKKANMGNLWDSL